MKRRWLKWVLGIWLFCGPFLVAEQVDTAKKEDANKPNLSLSLQSLSFKDSTSSLAPPEVGTLIGNGGGHTNYADINVSQGSLSFSETDLTLPGIGGLNLSIGRTYQSQEYTGEADLTQVGPKKWGYGIGFGWSSNMAMRAFVIAANDPGYNKVIIQRNGSTEEYRYRAKGSTYHRKKPYYDGIENDVDKIVKTTKKKNLQHGRVGSSTTTFQFSDTPLDIPGKGDYRSTNPKNLNIVRVVYGTDNSVGATIYLIEPGGTVTKFDTPFYHERYSDRSDRDVVHIKGLMVTSIYNQTEDFEKEGPNRIRFDYEEAEPNAVVDLKYRFTEHVYYEIDKDFQLMSLVPDMYENYINKSEEYSVSLNSELKIYHIISTLHKIRLKSVTDTMDRIVAFTYGGSHNKTTAASRKLYQLSGFTYKNHQGKTNTVRYGYDETGTLISAGVNNEPKHYYTYKKYKPNFGEYLYKYYHKGGRGDYEDYYFEPAYHGQAFSFYHGNIWWDRPHEIVYSRSYDDYLSGPLLTKRTLPTKATISYKYGDSMAINEILRQRTRSNDKYYYQTLSVGNSFPVVTEKTVASDNDTYTYGFYYKTIKDDRGETRFYKERYKPQWYLEDDVPTSFFFKHAIVTLPGNVKNLQLTFENGQLVRRSNGHFSTETQWDFSRNIKRSETSLVLSQPQTTTQYLAYDAFFTPTHIRTVIHPTGEQEVVTPLFEKRHIKYYDHLKKEPLTMENPIEEQVLKLPIFQTKKIDLETEKFTATNYVYDSFGQVTEKTMWHSDLPAGEPQERFSYDHRGRVTHIRQLNTNGKTVVTAKQYRESSGHYSIETLLNGKTSTVTHEAHTGKKVQSVDINGYGHSYTYDDVGRLLIVTAPDSSQTQKHYASDLRSVTTEAFGRSVTVYVDALGRKIKTETPPDSLDQETTYDSAGRPYKTKSGDIEITVEYDQYSRKIAQTHSLWGTSTIAYDDINNIVTKTDPQGRSMVTEKNKQGQVIRVTNVASGRTTRYDYNGFGQRINTIDPRGLHHPVTYDTAGRVTAEYRTSLSGSKAEKYKEIDTQYDNITGQVLERQVIGPDGSPRKFNYLYDDEDRLITLKYNGQTMEQLSYDQQDTANGKGRLSSEENPYSRVDYQYDNMGRVLEELRTNKINSQVHRYQHDYTIKGELSRQLVTDKKTNQTLYDTKYTFTPRGEIKQIYYKNTLIATYDYNKNGTIQSVTYGNGIKLENSYEKESLITKQTIRNHPELTEGKSYSYDNAGTPISQTYPNLFHKEEDNVPPRKIINRQYSYTQAEELEEVITNENKNYSYVYDNNSNILQYKNPREQKFKNQFVIAPESDRIIKRQYKGEGHREYYYDNDGNMIEEVYVTTEGKELGYMKLSYNYQGQIETVTKETGKAAEYAYNTKRERIHKRIYNGNQTEDIFYIWDAGGRIIAEENATKGETVKYIYGGNEKLAMVRVNEKTGKEEIYYYLNNLQGTPEAIIDGSRQIVQRIQLDEWGRIEKIMGKFQDEITFTGKKLDPETGFYYFNQRYYDPELMRFVSKDPAEQTLNPYLYAGSSPLVYVDPDGQWFFKAALSFLGPLGTGIGAAIDGMAWNATKSAATNAAFQQLFNHRVDWFSVGQAAKGAAISAGLTLNSYKPFGEASAFARIGNDFVQGGFNNVVGGIASNQHMSLNNTYQMFGEGGSKAAAIGSIRELHYFRNTLNTNIPEDLESAYTNGYKQDLGDSFHGPHQNIKLLKGPHITLPIKIKGQNIRLWAWSKEAVYSKTTGDLITNRHKGTYNYFRFFPVHTVVDVIPSLVWD